jgi:hypothetical protein
VGVVDLYGEDELIGSDVEVNSDNSNEFMTEEDI